MHRRIKLGEQSFLQMPRIVDNDEKISYSAKYLYMKFFDRIKVSEKNGWIDDKLGVYIYYTIESIKEDLGIGQRKAIQLKRELIDRGLIEEVRQGLNKPNKIYLINLDDVYSDEERKKYIAKDE